MRLRHKWHVRVMNCVLQEICKMSGCKVTHMNQASNTWKTLSMGGGENKNEGKIFHQSQHCASLKKNRSGLNTLSLQLWGKSILSCVKVQTQTWPLQLCLKINTTYGEGERGGRLWCFMNASNKIFWIIHVSHYSCIFFSLVQTILIPPQYQIETYYIRLKQKIVLLYTECTKNTQWFWNLTVIIYSNVLNLVDGVLVSETLHCGSGIVYQKRVLQLQDVVTDSIFKDVMLLVAIHCYCGYWNSIKKDQWRTVNCKITSYIWQSGADKRWHNAKVLSIVTAGLYWTTQWSRTKCHIQTAMVQMNSHRYGMYLIVLI